MIAETLTTRPTRYRSGDTLPNGATVTASEAGPSGEVLLCRWDRPGRPTQWVTWLVSRSGETVDGHYYEDIVPAARDFRARASGRNQQET